METARSIDEWQQSVFGTKNGHSVDEVTRTYTKLREEWSEMTELIHLVDQAPDPEQWVHIAEEATDVAIVCFGLIRALGYDPQTLLDMKMGINRKRQWGQGPDGTRRHIDTFTVDGQVYVFCEHDGDPALPSVCPCPDNCACRAKGGVHEHQKEVLAMNKERDLRRAGLSIGGLRKWKCPVTDCDATSPDMVHAHTVVYRNTDLDR